MHYEDEYVDGDEEPLKTNACENKTDDKIERLLNTCEVDRQSTPSTSHGDKFLVTIHDQIKTKEKTGDRINQELADIINELMFKSTRPDDDDVKSKLDSIVRPDNCPSLVATRVDELIWSLMRPHSQSMDKKFQKCQLMIVKTVSLLAVITDKIYNMKKNLDKGSGPNIVNDSLGEVVKDLIDTIQMASLANFELHMRRREHIRPDVHANYMPLFSVTVPVNSFLFGGEATKKLEDIEKSCKAANKARPRDYNTFTRGPSRFPYKGRYPGRARHRPYRSGPYQPFLAKRGGYAAFRGNKRLMKHGQSQ
ncbi:uncharacterized protein [Haliotis cracherodii]|uniref:uncharacterized protein n=1 Tax=Haliotis cracherodii TaxID=6455 RepID=UPI0039E76102